MLDGSELYGITTDGGSANDGVLFSFNTTSSTYNVLHDFGGKADGANPMGGLVLVDSRLYGTASAGGSAGDGTVYSFDPATDNLAIVHNFMGTPNDGQNPHSDLTSLGNTIYGTTYGGGTNGAGILFSIAVPEPSTLVLLALGAVVLLGYAWRRRRLAKWATRDEEDDVPVTLSLSSFTSGTQISQALLRRVMLHAGQRLRRSSPGCRPQAAGIRHNASSEASGAVGLGLQAVDQFGRLANS